MTDAETNGLYRKEHEVPKTLHLSNPRCLHAGILMTLGSRLNYWCAFEVRRAPGITFSYLKCVLSLKNSRNCSMISLQ